MNPVDGQIMEINEALNAVVDLKGEKIDFKRDESIKDDIVYTGEGSDGKTYNIQLQSKMVVVSVFETPPKPKEIKTKVAPATTKTNTTKDNKDNKDNKDKDNNTKTSTKKY